MLRILSCLVFSPPRASCLWGAILIWTLPEPDLRPTPSLAEPAVGLLLPAWLLLLYTRDTVSLLGLTCLMAALISFPLAWFTRFFSTPVPAFSVARGAQQLRIRTRAGSEAASEKT